MSSSSSPLLSRILAESNVAERAQLLAALAPRARDRVADARRARSPWPPGRAGSCSRRAGTGSRAAPAARRRRASRRAARRKRLSKRNSFRCVPTKSRTVHTLFPAAFRSPRPSCWRNSSRAVGRAEKEQRVDRRDVDPLVEEVDREDRAHVAVGEVAERSPALVGTARRRERHGREAKLGEALGHELSVADADAEAERPHRRRIGDLPPDLLDHQTRPGVVRREDVLERSDVVSLSAAPRDACAGRGRRGRRSRQTVQGTAGRSHPRAAAPPRSGRRSSGGRRGRPFAPASPSGRAARPAEMLKELPRRTAPPRDGTRPRSRRRSASARCAGRRLGAGSGSTRTRARSCVGRSPADPLLAESGVA